MVDYPSDLLGRFRSGDREAFQQLVREMGPRLKGFFLRQGAQPATAEDLTQDVFLRIYNSTTSYQATGRLEAYFFRIARNIWIDSRRKKKPVSLGDGQPDSVDEALSPVDQVDIADRAARLRQWVHELEPESRELIELAVLQQLPYKEVSDILEIPVGTVKSRVFYTLRRLREQASSIDPKHDYCGDEQ